MREIKFRAFINGEMIDADSLAFDEYLPLCDQLASCENLMQYTGLKDKNGVKIYEGDILYIAGLGNCLVGSEDGFFGFTIESKGGIENIGHSLEDIEHIIGNIHENPKLLEQQK